MNSRHPYLLAVVATLMVLAGYLVTLAPTVTFWDAGEFIAAAKTLGIPHPPGTPLFVLIGHVWAALVPLREYAQRTNLLSATLSACGSGLLFLVAHETMARVAAGLSGFQERLVRLGGSFAAALIAGFTFTNWQNSNETEVYAAATFTIALIAWLCVVWRGARGTERAARLELLILYLAGLSIGNHLLALLVGPAVIAYMASVLREDPAADQRTRAVEWARVTVVAGTWALLIGCGLGSTVLVGLGALCFLAAAGFAARASSLRFALLALAVSAVAVTSYLFLFIRAGQHPMINEAQPDTWDALLAVIRRAQYPVRTPLDDPTVLHGPENPGRSLAIIGLQLLNYLQYFDWQWANGVRSSLRFAAVEFPVRTFATLLFAGLGLYGMQIQRRVDRSTWWLWFTLWLVTGLGLVAYMNFKPGLGLGYGRYPDSNAHEVRDRDYFFVVSFVVWGAWAGMGLAAATARAITRWRLKALVIAIPFALVALVPFTANLPAATRRGPDARLAADFAYDLLNSVPPYGILFTYGDNDTFPLWWAQEVEGVRRDVLVVCLALGETSWYKRQIRETPTRGFDESAAPAIWRGGNPVAPTWRPHGLTDEQIAGAQGALLPQDIGVRIGPINHQLRRGTPLYSRDFMVLRILQDNLGRRPIAWAMTTGRNYLGLDRYLLQQGLVMSLQTTVVDTTSPVVDNRRVLGVPLDLATTERLVWETYRYAGLASGAHGDLEPTAAGVANNFAIVLSQLAYAFEARGDHDNAARNVAMAGRVSANPSLGWALTNLLTQPYAGSDSRPYK